MIGFPAPGDMRSAAVARAHYVIARCMVLGYLGVMVMVAAGFALVPSPVWGMPMGIAVLMGARASRWCLAYRKWRANLGVEA